MTAAPLDLFEKRFLDVREAHPSLTDYGFGLYAGEKDPDKRSDDHLRALLRLDDALPHVVRVADWLRENIAPIKTPGGHAHSYVLKHYAESCIGDYVSNGELIAAALMEGYPMRRLDGPNALFGMSRADVDAVRRRAASAKAGRWSA